MSSEFRWGPPYSDAILETVDTANPKRTTLLRITPEGHAIGDEAITGDEESLAAARARINEVVERERIRHGGKP